MSFAPCVYCGIHRCELVDNEPVCAKHLDLPALDPDWPVFLERRARATHERWWLDRFPVADIREMARSVA